MALRRWGICESDMTPTTYGFDIVFILSANRMERAGFHVKETSNQNAADNRAV